MGGETPTCVESTHSSTKGILTDSVLGPNTPENGKSSGSSVGGARRAPSVSKLGVDVDPASLWTSSRHPIVPLGASRDFFVGEAYLKRGLSHKGKSSS